MIRHILPSRKYASHPDEVDALLREWREEKRRESRTAEHLEEFHEENPT